MPGEARSSCCLASAWPCGDSSSIRLNGMPRFSRYSMILRLRRQDRDAVICHVRPRYQPAEAG
jgi:hypothetical protein